MDRPSAEKTSLPQEGARCNLWSAHIHYLTSQRASWDETLREDPLTAQMSFSCQYSTPMLRASGAAFSRLQLVMAVS